ncbi:MAG TPA: RnfABCDGE type electron transport complex subunit G [Bacteroidales bacterium]|nr:RnfABCDGE type electron transport complex subunit G [Bacteroidales bacterium]
MAKKLESTLRNMALSLFIICGTMSAALGYVYSLTKGPIENAEKQKVNNAIKLVVPEFDNDPGSEAYKVDDLDFFPAKKNGQLVAVAIKTYSDNGFSGHISVMVGIKPDGSICGTSVMQQKETPGLGTKMKEPKFRDQFNGKNPDHFKIKVKKDGGDVDAITAATISSRAFCDAVNRAYEAFKKSPQAGISSTQNNSTAQTEGGAK